MLTWTNETRKLSDLIPWPRNPRKIQGDQAKRLSESLDEFGQVDVIAIGPGNEVYNGHQRLDVWAQEHGPEYEVAVRVASRELTEKEREKLVVLLHKGAVGDWNFDTLANEFEFDELLEWGFEEDELAGVDWQNAKLKEREQAIRQREMFRVLISVPVDNALDIREVIEGLRNIRGIEIDYGAN